MPSSANFEQVKNAFAHIDTQVREQLSSLQEHYNAHAEDDRDEVTLDGSQITVATKAALRKAGMCPKGVHYTNLLTNYRNYLHAEMSKGEAGAEEITSALHFAAERINSAIDSTPGHELYRDKSGATHAEAGSRFVMPKVSISLN